MDVYVVLGHDRNGAWVVGVYKTYDLARQAELAEKKTSKFREEFFSILCKKVEGEP